MKILITGATGGIGEAVSLKLAEQGYDLLLHTYSQEKKLEDLINKLQNVYPNQEFSMTCADLSCQQGVNQLVQDLSSDLDGFVYTSGKSIYGLVTDISDEDLNLMIQLHVKSPFLIAQSMLPNLIKRKSGQIVMVSSIWGEIGASCEVLYSTVKGAQNAFVKSLAKEVAPSGIMVNAVAPGVVNTPMMSTFSEQEKEQLSNEIPIGRFAEPEEISEVISFLLSKQNSYLTGQVLTVNGGWII